MKVEIHPSNIKGEVLIPPSKSAMQRIVALAMMHRGITRINNFGNSDDEQVAISIMKSVGCTYEISNKLLVIKSYGDFISDSIIQFGESGLSARLFTPLFATSTRLAHLEGSGSLKRRNMHVLIDNLQKNGVVVKHNGYTFPVHIKGPMNFSDMHLDGSQSSQDITGMIFAACHAAIQPISISVKQPVSIPYIQLSVDLLQRFGYDIHSNESCTEIKISPKKPLHLTEIEIDVEADWSSASFLIVAAILAGDLLLHGLDINSFQADRKLLDLLQETKHTFEFKAGVLSVKKSTTIPTFDVDATDCPDLFPPLVVLAAYAQGKSTIKGVGRLLNKESDRAQSLKKEFERLGVEIRLVGDVMEVHGIGKTHGAVVRSHNDHRIAMALSIAGLRSEGTVIIEDAEVVAKSFPDFFEVLEQLNVTLDKS